MLAIKKFFIYRSLSHLDDEKLEGKSCCSKSDFATTISLDSSITEEKKSTTPSTPNTTTAKIDAKEDNNEPEQYKFVPRERKPEYTFTLLITSQGQEVLKSIDLC